MDEGQAEPAALPGSHGAHRRPADTAMDKPEHNEEALEALMALADGELDVAERGRVLARLARDREAAAQVLWQQQLRESIGRAMTGSAPSAPHELRDRVEQLAARTPAGSDGPHVTGHARRAPLGRVGAWVPAAVAAVLLVSSLAVFYAAASRSAGGGDGQSVLPASFARRFAQRHVQCSGDIAMLERAEAFPRELSRLPDELTAHFGSRPTPSLDLSALGYDFHAAGLCTLPGRNAVHLVYHAAERTGRHDSISLWMKSYAGTPPIEVGRVYAGPDDASVHPLVLWRDAGMIYFLVGDKQARVEAAAQRLSGGI